MNRIIIVFVVIPMVLLACKSKTEEPAENINYASYGERISSKAVLTKDEMMQKFTSLSQGDTVNLKFTSTVNEVCKKKGCWMKLDLGKDQETMVRFKDYGFFVPKDIAGKEVVLNGLAFVEEMSVEDQRHYAKDAGKSDEDIANITGPKRSFGFEADGLLIVN